MTIRDRTHLEPEVEQWLRLPCESSPLSSEGEHAKQSGGVRLATKVGVFVNSRSIAPSQVLNFGVLCPKSDC